MNGLTHKQAIKWIHRRLDGLLSEKQLSLLEEHLNSCDSCRAYAAEMDLLPARLQNEFHARWDEKPGPSQNVIEYVASKARKLPMANRISSAIKLFAGGATLVLLAFLVNFVISQLQINSTTETEPADSSPLAGDRLLAFTSAIDTGNLDIYTLRPDGSGLTNLTNNPANDVAPFWSPDGKRIAFESDRNGFKQIFLMNADGTGVIPLTHDDALYEIGVKDGNNFTPWSLDGKNLIISQRSPEEFRWMLYTIDINQGNKSPLVDEPGEYFHPSWSPDGRHVAFVLDDHQTPGGDQIYVVNPDGSNPREITKSLSEDTLLYYYNYYWSPDGHSIIFITQSNIYPNDWTVYEVDLESMTPVEKAFSSLRLEDWWQGTSFIVKDDLSTVTWLRSDGTSNTLKPLEICPLAEQSQIKQSEFGWFAQRSSSNNQVINIHCVNDMQFYYANSDGTIVRQLLNISISHTEGFVTDIVWSPDDQFIAFNIASPDKTDMYVLNMEEALNNPSTQPLKITISGGELFYSPSWQPSP